MEIPANIYWSRRSVELVFCRFRDIFLRCNIKSNRNGWRNVQWMSYTKYLCFLYWNLNKYESKNAIFSWISWVSSPVIIISLDNHFPFQFTHIWLFIASTFGRVQWIVKFTEIASKYFDVQILNFSKCTKTTW